MSDSEAIELFKGLIEALRDPSNVHGIIEECRALAAAATQLDELLERIQKLLDGTGPDIFKERIGGLKQKYVSLLGQSRDAASLTESRLRRFDQVFLEIAQSVESKDEVVEAAEALKQFAKESMSGINHLAALEECREFPTHLKNLNEEYTSKGLGNATVGADIQALADQINEKIGNLKRQIVQAASVSLGNGGPVQALVTLVNLAPGGIATNSILDMLSAKKAHAMREIASLESDVGAKIDQLDDNPAKIKASLDQAVWLSERIANRLSYVSGAAWSNISADAQSLADDLARYDSTNFDEATKLRTAFLRALSTPLEEGLKAYAQSIAG